MEESTTASQDVVLDPYAEALEFAHHGYAVVPAYSVDPATGGCSCKRGTECTSPGKHPRTSHGKDDATTNISQLDHWHSTWPNANWLASCTDLAVIDLDPKHEADPAQTLMEYGLAENPMTWTGEYDGERGMHVYCAGPTKTVSQTTSPIAGAEVRGEGTMVIIAGSLHHSGVRYEWADSVRPWDDSFSESGLPRVPGAFTQEHDEYHEDEDYEPSKVLREGERNHGLTSYAGKLRYAGMSEDEILGALLVVNETRCKPPLPDDEVLSIARSISKRDTAIDKEVHKMRVREEAARFRRVSASRRS
jgi:putative DNA primase/helicase